VTEGELYSARSLRLSDIRVRNLGFFEDVTFEPRPTQDPSQLDLDVTVVERPTGSFSFGAGYSSQDSIVLTASLAQSNLFGRGYAVNLTADFGPTRDGTNRFFLSFSDPYFLGSSFSFGATGFLTELQYENFRQRQYGIDLSLGHALTEDNRTRGFLRYSLATREIERDLGSAGAATILRELQAGGETTSMIGISVRSDTRDDRFAPTSGYNWGGTLEYAGIGGFTEFLRAEARISAYLGAPSWLFERSTFVVSTRIGYTIPFNSVSDFGPAIETSQCAFLGCGSNIQPLNAIDTNLKLPLTERYFLGGIGTFQLRGFKARSVGPRRTIVTQDFQTGEYYPLGRTVEYDPATGFEAVCNSPEGCNNLTDRKDKSFANLNLTDVVGGSSFISSSFEYRFPVSESLGLLAIVFVDMGNAFAEGENLFDVRDWRFGSGAGLLWFSPFGPLQVVLGFPLDPLSIDKSPVFEFSVGGVGL
jgi:outer membrane protein insertion porin family